MHTRCKPGDLAIIIRAVNSINLGRIVRVIAPHDGTGDITYNAAIAGPAWLIEAAQPLLWGWPGKFFHRTSGPAADSQLQPIRGDSAKPPRKAKRKAPAPIKQTTPEVTP